MRILIISFYFPPYNIIASLRVGKTAKYLYQFGHDVRVITAHRLPYPPDLPVEIPEDRIIATTWIDVNAPETLTRHALRHFLRSFIQPKHTVQTQNSRLLLQNLRDAYQTIVAFPDGAIGWLPFGLSAAHQLLRRWRPDIILASSGPPTSLLIAHSLHHRYGLAWVGELRDLWTDSHYYVYPMWRRVLEIWLERRILRTASGLVTVSEPLARTLRLRYNLPTEIILNGFDLSDYPLQTPERSQALLTIVYTGTIYPKNQTAAPLFVALQSLGEIAAQIRIVIYSHSINGIALIKAEAHRYGVAHLLDIRAAVPYRTALAQQRAADVLLLLLWNDPRERGIYTGKLFEYFGARRPILGIGPDDNVVADLIRSRQAGFVSADPNLIAAQLIRWLDMKRQGEIPDLPESAIAGLSREAQARLLEAFLTTLVNVRSE